MSNLSEQCEQECDDHTRAEAIELIVHPRDKDLGGFSVRRALPTVQRRMVGPWVFFDHMGPADFPAGQGIDVRPHPHIGIATVTYLFEGEILHRDSLGSYQPIRPGDINLMVTGSGIVHSERERDEVRSSDHRLHGLQLWMALPEAQQEIDPAFYHYPGSSIPQVDVAGVPVRVMMGTAYGATSPVKVFSETLYIEAHLQPGQELTLPAADERAVYVAHGELETAGKSLPEHSMAIFARDAEVTVRALRETRLALVGGEAFGQRFIEWNFVSSSKERIERAKDDWREGRFPRVPGDEEEFIPLP